MCSQIIRLSLSGMVFPKFTRISSSFVISGTNSSVSYTFVFPLNMVNTRFNPNSILSFFTFLCIMGKQIEGKIPEWSETMTYDEAMTYIQKAGSAGIQMGLTRMRELCRRLGDPQDKLSFIHVAGTNGKGSTAAYISSILGVNGYLVGRYVSPVVFQYEECIQYEDMEGVHPIDRELLAELMTEAADAVESMAADGQERPTIFEIETAVSFLAFVRWQCSVVVLEVGMGGREDATNVIKHILASVITPISRDHMSVLGDTLTEIACEKAGIIRENGRVISYQKEPEAAGVITEVCREKGAVLTPVRETDMELISMDLRGSVFSYRGENYRTKMTGTYQMENACLAIETCRCLADHFPMSTERLIVGVREAYWRGRFEVVCPDPLIIVDGAHNESGARALAESVQKLLPGCHVHGIMGVFRDKEYETMVQILHPVIQDVIAVTAPGPRGLPATELAQVWEKYDVGAIGIADSVLDGLKMAIGRCKEGDAILLFGSLSLLGQLKWRT